MDILDAPAQASCIPGQFNRNRFEVQIMSLVSVNSKSWDVLGQRSGRNQLLGLYIFVKAVILAFPYGNHLIVSNRVTQIQIPVQSY